MKKIENSFFNNNYRIASKIGAGSFGDIFLGFKSCGKKVAIKIERQDAKYLQLQHENLMYTELVGSTGFCSTHFYGSELNCNMLVMDLLGPSLEDLFTICNRKFSLKTVLQIADQLLARVETLHDKHIIHRDIKTANFTVGLNENAGTIFCVDFGLSKFYRHPKTLKHNPIHCGKSMTGTPRYASINVHQGVEPSRRDDLESICYMLIYFLKGRLPWQGIKAENQEQKYQLILEKKMNISIAELCEDCPSIFEDSLTYARSLEYEASPNISYLRSLFKDLYRKESFDEVYDAKLWDWDGIDTSAAAIPELQQLTKHEPVPPQKSFAAQIYRDREFPLAKQMLMFTAVCPSSQFFAADICEQDNRGHCYFYRAFEPEVITEEYLQETLQSEARLREEIRLANASAKKRKTPQGSKTRPPTRPAIDCKRIKKEAQQLEQEQQQNLRNTLQEQEQKLQQQTQLLQQQSQQLQQCLQQLQQHQLLLEQQTQQLEKQQQQLQQFEHRRIVMERESEHQRQLLLDMVQKQNTAQSTQDNCYVFSAFQPITTTIPSHTTEQLLPLEMSSTDEQGNTIVHNAFQPVKVLPKESEGHWEQYMDMLKAEESSSPQGIVAAISTQPDQDVIQQLVPAEQQQLQQEL